MHTHTQSALKTGGEGETHTHTHRQNPVYHEGPDYGRARCRGAPGDREEESKTADERIMEI